MLIRDIAAQLESVAPLSLQEDYDNAGLIAGDPAWTCTGILCTLDVTVEVIEEAMQKKCNCVVAHHPLIFRGLKKINGRSQVEKALIMAIKNDVAVYASHTNLDNLPHGVNGRIADLIGLRDRKVLDPKPAQLKKLVSFVPVAQLEAVRDALFAAGAGHIGNYSECSFVHPGTGTFKPEAGTHPFSGQQGLRQNEPEIRLEVIVPVYRLQAVLHTLIQVHPYEEPAYDILELSNLYSGTGAGLMGTIDEIGEQDFLELLSSRFRVPVVRHTPLTGQPVRQAAVCGGAGSFLIAKALSAGVNAYVTADIKYHEFFGAEGRMLLCDIGHYESEQFTVDLLQEILVGKFPTFAVLKSEVKTNPVQYFTGITRKSGNTHG